MRTSSWSWVMAAWMLWAGAVPVRADSYTQSVPVLVIVEPPSTTNLDVPEPVEEEAMDPLAPPDGALITTRTDDGTITILYTKTE